MLTTQVTEEEVYDALKKISDLTAPGVNGYRAKFYKATWYIIKKNIIDAL